MPNNTLVENLNRELIEPIVEDICPQLERICLENSENSAFYEYDPADDIDDGSGIKLEQLIKVIFTHVAFDLIALAFFSLIGFGVNISLQNTYINLETDTLLDKNVVKTELLKANTR